METINDIVREVAAEMLNTSMQEITAERIHGWATRLGEVVVAKIETTTPTCKESLQVGNESLTPNEMEMTNDILCEMREFADADSQTIGRDVLRRQIQHFADRIEAAYKRETVTTGYWCDKFETAYEQDMLDRDKQKCADLDALELAMERVLDPEALKAVIVEKRKIKEGANDEQ